MRGSPCSFSVADDVLDLRRFLHAQRRRRLVHDHQLRGKGGGPRDRDALPLAARHVADRVRQVRDLHRRLLQRRHRRGAHPAAVEDRERTRGSSEFARGRGKDSTARRDRRRARGSGTPSRSRPRAPRADSSNSTSLPLNQILPAVLRSTAVICRTKVDLPAPLSPMMATCSPLVSTKSAPSSA